MIKQRVHMAKSGYILASVASIILGIVIVIRPGMSANLICTIAGCVILAAGIAKLFGYFTNDLYRLAFQYDFALGILTIVLGALMILLPGQLSQAFIIVAGIYVVVNAFFTLQTSIEAKKFGLTKWWLMLVSAVISGALGVLLLTRPAQSIAAIAWILGVTFIADGLQNLLVALLTIRARAEHIPR